MNDSRRSEAVAKITEGFRTLMELQARGAANLPEHLHPLDQADMRTAFLGAFVELGEWANETQWKPWREYGKPDQEAIERILDEAADFQHFYAWIMRSIEAQYGISPEDLALAFIRKHEVNIKRFKGEVPGREPPRPVDPFANAQRRPPAGPRTMNDAFMPPTGWTPPDQVVEGLEEYCPTCGASWCCPPGRCTKEAVVGE